MIKKDCLIFATVLANCHSLYRHTNKLGFYPLAFKNVACQHGKINKQADYFLSGVNKVTVDCSVSFVAVLKVVNLLQAKTIPFWVEKTQHLPSADIEQWKIAMKVAVCPPGYTLEIPSSWEVNRQLAYGLAE